MIETKTILITILVALVSALLVIITLYRALKKNRRLLELQEREYRFSAQLMQSRLAVQEQTLKNMAAEMYDNVAQVLGAVKLQLHLLASGASAGEYKTVADEAAANIGAVIRDVRNISYGMNGTYTLHHGLKESIEKDLGRIVAARRIKCNFTLSGQEQGMGEGRELILYDLVQQCVADAVKHGNLSEISVAMEYGAGHISVVIQDDRGDAANIGELDIEEPVRLLNGKVNITPRLHKGTIVELKIPL